jgi:hypothetical protein
MIFPVAKVFPELLSILEKLGDGLTQLRDVRGGMVGTWQPAWAAQLPVAHLVTCRAWYALSQRSSTATAETKS